MAKELSYKRSTSLVLKAFGMLDVKNETIEFENETKKIIDLIKDFDGLDIELSCKVSTTEDMEISNKDTIEPITNKE